MRTVHECGSTHTWAVEEFPLPAEAMREGKLRELAGGLARNGNEGPSNVDEQLRKARAVEQGVSRANMSRHVEDKTLYLENVRRRRALHMHGKGSTGSSQYEPGILDHLE